MSAELVGAAWSSGMKSIQTVRRATPIVALAMLIALAIVNSRVLAQIGGPPGPPSAPAPAGRSATGLQPLAPLPAAAPLLSPGTAPTTGALPQLAPAPRVVQGSPAPPQSVFRCSCFGNGTG